MLLSLCALVATGAEVAKSCHSCGSTDFRLSRFRRSDLAKLIALLYPVRCLRCRERCFAPLLQALEYRRPGARRTKRHTQSGPPKNVIRLASPLGVFCRFHLQRSEIAVSQQGALRDPEKCDRLITDGNHLQS